MNQALTGQQQLNEKWIKASILGTIWASSEIVLGSFLHNLRIPFSGNILTAIGLIILISASYQWNERGLFWRAGIICALLKTMSPSAVIFGPMVAIFSEAVLLEISVRILGKTIPGFIVGSILAMSWNLFQKIINFIIFYGYNIVEVYTNLMQFAQRQLNLKVDAVWAPIVLLLIMYALFGSVSALVGIKTGRKLASSTAPSRITLKSEKTNGIPKKKDPDFSYSLAWLIMNILFLAGTFLLPGKINFGLWIILSATVATTWAIRYKRALRQLVRPGLWLFFVIITMGTTFVFSRLHSETLPVTDAILVGVEMNVRAIILIMGFSVLGTELYNPKIRAFLARGYFKQLPPALELSLESLPSMIAAVPDLKTTLKNPVQVIHQLMLHAESRMSEIRQNFNNNPDIFIITGKIGSGKTTCIKKLTEKLKSENISVGGFYSSRMMENGETTGYMIVDISSGHKEKLLDINNNGHQKKVGNYYIREEAIERGNLALQQTNAQLMVIDEVGKLELNGGGWAEMLGKLLVSRQNQLLISIRKEVLNEVINKWKINPVMIYDTAENNDEKLYLGIINHSGIIK